MLVSAWLWGYDSYSIFTAYMTQVTQPNMLFYWRPCTQFNMFLWCSCYRGVCCVLCCQTVCHSNITSKPHAFQAPSRTGCVQWRLQYATWHAEQSSPNSHRHTYTHSMITYLLYHFLFLKIRFTYLLHTSSTSLHKPRCLQNILVRPKTSITVSSEVLAFIEVFRHHHTGWSGQVREYINPTSHYPIFLLPPISFFL